MSRVEIEIPPRSAFVGVVRLAIASLARAAGLDEDAVDDVKIAVSEACTSAVIAQEEQGADQPVRIAWTREDEEVVVEVHSHEGPSGPQAATDSQGFSTRAVMSQALLRSLAREVDVGRAEDGGTLTRLTFPAT